MNHPKPAHAATWTKEMGGMMEHMTVYTKLGMTFGIASLIFIAASGALIESVVYRNRFVMTHRILFGIGVALLVCIPLVFLHYVWFGN